MTANDTGILGSGTKGYISTAVMRMVDQGLVNLDDPAFMHIDPSLTRSWNKTMEDLFGSLVNNVTVHDLMFMQSGLGDFETPTRDKDLLLPNESMIVHDPMENLQFVSDLTRGEFCVATCTWNFEPGTHTSYTSTNYILLGLILATHAPVGHNTWDTVDIYESLGFNETDYPRTRFPAVGTTHEQGVTSVGLSLMCG